MTSDNKHRPHLPGGEHAAPTLGSAAAALDVRTNGRDPVPELPPNPHFERIGGEATVRELVERFYHHMDTLPEAGTIRAMHGADLGPIKDVLYKFLVGWLGGPQLYVAEHGHPRLRRKHLPFAISDAERDAWMACMLRALDDVVADEALRIDLAGAFFKTASFIRNQP